MEVGCDRLVAGRRLPKEAQSTRFLQVMWGYFSANISPGRCVFRRIYDERSLAYPANGAQATHVSTQVPPVALCLRWIQEYGDRTGTHTDIINCSALRSL